MNFHSRLKIQASAMLLLISFGSQTAARQKPNASGNSGAVNAPAKRLTLSKAFVVDDRLSTLRREPDLQSEVIHRLRLGRAVYIVGTARGTARTNADTLYCRVAVTRRTRGWVLGSALALPWKPGEDKRVMKLIEATRDGLDRISLCRLLIERFPQSQLVPRALLLMGEEADRAAQSLTHRARKRLADASDDNWNASTRDYFLNDVGLDRYSKLHIVFDFNESTSEYVYDGRAYADLVRRFPDREEAGRAREHIELDKQKRAPAFVKKVK